MAKDAYINARVEKSLKQDAAKVLGRVDLSMTDAIRVFLRQVVLQNGLPFEVRIPNKETRAAMRELDAGGGKVHTGTTKEILQEIVESDD